jgi:uncharacterized protein (TIGR03435 family)
MAFQRLLWPSVVAFVLAVTLSAQEAKPTFEVASVRHVPEQRDSIFLPRTSPRALASGRFDATTTLRILIGWAFRPEVPIEGSFRELDEVFVIAAQAPGPVVPAGQFEVGPVNLMLQSLLADRFKLRLRRETRSFPVFALRRTDTKRLGRNLKPLDVTCPEGRPGIASEPLEGCMTRLIQGRGQVRGGVRSMADFARFVTMFAGQRVVDDTGLAGPFALTTTFNPQSDVRSGPPAEEHLPSLRDALQYDLGLKLETDRRDFEVLIVEHVEQPSDN